MTQRLRYDATVPEKVTDFERRIKLAKNRAPYPKRAKVQIDVETAEALIAAYKAQRAAEYIGFPPE